jgi:hypothetical protein
MREILLLDFRREKMDADSVALARPIDVRVERRELASIIEANVVRFDDRTSGPHAPHKTEAPVPRPAVTQLCCGESLVQAAPRWIFVIQGKRDSVGLDRWHVGVQRALSQSLLDIISKRQIITGILAKKDVIKDDGDEVVKGMMRAPGQWLRCDLAAIGLPSQAEPSASRLPTRPSSRVYAVSNPSIILLSLPNGVDGGQSRLANLRRGIN